jgi:ABC-type Fe3+ transport system permease subunit
VFLIGISLLLALPAPVDRLYLVPTVRRDSQERLFLDRDEPDPRQLRQCLGPGQDPDVLLEHLIILIPAVIVVLLLASAIAFAVSRFSFRFNLFLLMLFTAGNLLRPR